jgi:hypothetical protein
MKINSVKNLLKDSVMRFFDSGFDQRTSSSPIIHTKKGFQIFPNIKGFLCFHDQLPSIFTNGESKLLGVFTT